MRYLLAIMTQTSTLAFQDGNILYYFAEGHISIIINNKFLSTTLELLKFSTLALRNLEYLLRNLQLRFQLSYLDRRVLIGELGIAQRKYFDLYNIYRLKMSQQADKGYPQNLKEGKQGNVSLPELTGTLEAQNLYPEVGEYQYSDEQYQRNNQTYQEYPVEHHYTDSNHYYAYDQPQPFAQPAQWNHAGNQGWSQGPPHHFKYHDSPWAQQPHPLAGFKHNPHPHNFYYQPFFPDFPRSSPPIAESPNVFPAYYHQKNKRCHQNRGKFHGYGRGMGRGRCNEFRKNSTSEEKGGKKQRHQNYKSKHQYEKRKQKIDESSSSSEEEVNQLQEKMNNLCVQKGTLNEKNITECLTPFFDKYNVSKKGAQKVCEYLLGKFSDVKDLDPLISVLYGLEINSPQLLSLQYYGFTAVIKQIVKKNSDIQMVKKSLIKKQDLKKKKEMHDSKFSEKFPNPVEIDFLQKEDLLNLDLNKTLFLIDANNVMPKQKHFRHYFENKNEKKKAEGQIRLIWMAYQARIKAEIFFDNKYSSAMYDTITKYLLTEEQEKNIGAIPVHYAQKQLNPNNTADLKLVARLAEIVENQSYKDHEIVLVSADKELGQLCSAIFPVKKTSGLYIFKYCKALIKQRNFGNKEMKGIVKDIFKF